MGHTCKLCGEPVDQYAEDTAKEVTGWVGGHKKDSMSLRHDTGEYAHGDCVRAAKMGVPPEQITLFDDPLPDLFPVPAPRPEDELEF